MSCVHQKKNKYTIGDFQLKLHQETWEQVFEGNDVDMIFNSFSNYFFLTYPSFPLIQVMNKMNQNC
jgi:hypothetical protein